MWQEWEMQRATGAPRTPGTRVIRERSGKAAPGQGHKRPGRCWVWGSGERRRSRKILALGLSPSKGAEERKNRVCVENYNSYFNCSIKYGRSGKISLERWSGSAWGCMWYLGWLRWSVGTQSTGKVNIPLSRGWQLLTLTTIWNLNNLS